MDDRQLYEEWRASARFSSSQTREKTDEEKFAESTHNFFDDMPERVVVPKKESLSETYLNQLKMTGAEGGLNSIYLHSRPEMMSTYTVTNMIMQEALGKMAESTGMPPKLTTAKEGDMNVTLREGSDVWRRQTYTSPKDRADLFTSTSRADYK
eukprot:TRINITY_DN3828_c0_g2_i8.p1 TRINITY_DN3828_c0_g2~~TRINITY_DN3828_c0_g2_i8.p1  ORF type:complete len:153 (+),score=39.15 TRINITY_DN3828_c0_g2_i8:149-607(+)